MSQAFSFTLYVRRLKPARSSFSFPSPRQLERSANLLRRFIRYGSRSTSGTANRRPSGICKLVTVIMSHELETDVVLPLAALFLTLVSTLVADVGMFVIFEIPRILS